MSIIAKEVNRKNRFSRKKAVRNFMGGISYEVNPLDTLKMITASSIFGEPQYYRRGIAGVSDGKYRLNSLFRGYSVLPSEYDGKTTSEIMEEAIDASLSYDFEGTLLWADTLRNEYNMRLNPQVIMVRASMHPGMEAFGRNRPGIFAEIESRVMARADEPSAQFAYYLFKNGGKNGLPNALKRAWAGKLGSLDAYAVNKYKNAEIKMIDTVRVCHAHSSVLDELMRTGSVSVPESGKTWEMLRSEGKSWREILSEIRLGHMALLRNLRGIFTETEDYELCLRTMKTLKEGVCGGKQFPFRYLQAMNAVNAANGIYHRQLILDTLEECMDISCDNLPRLRGRTICLSDNSASAWGAITSEYGSVRVAEIDNLSSLITARNSDEGFVGKFGDRLIEMPVSKRNGILAQTQTLSANRYSDVGGNTENGIWIFFRDAIDQKKHWDNIFIYSDMQAGHGGLYGTKEGKKEYTSRGFLCGSGYIDVAKLISEYRREVNPRVNIFCVQTAGYSNVLVPEYGYRTNILYGWTGKELLFADRMIRLWDQAEKANGEG